MLLIRPTLLITNGCAAAAIKSKIALGTLTDGDAAMNDAHAVHEVVY